MLDRIASFTGSMLTDSLAQTLTSRLNQLTAEVASGQKANPAGALGTGAGLLYQLHALSDMRAALQTSLTLASQRLDTIQTALTAIGSGVQAVSSAALLDASPGSNGTTNLGVLATQSRAALSQILGQLNTSFDGAAVFNGDNAAPPMQPAATATGAVDAALASAVAIKGGPLTQSDVPALAASIGTAVSNGFFTGTSDDKPTTVLIGASQTLQYNAQANQPAITGLLQGLSMLGLLGAPSTQLDASAKSALLSQATQLIDTGQTALTQQQGTLGAIQSQVQDAVTVQQTAASATQTQILGYEQANTAGDATQISALQVQLQATYDLTAQISQLSLVHYMPTPA